MSAFIVDKDTINGIVAFITENKDGDWIKYDFKKEFMKLKIDLSTPAGVQKLCDEMVKTNCQGVCYRYNENYAAAVKKYKFKYSPKTINGYQAVKSIGCWSYQCMEGNVPDKSRLYKLMGRIEEALALHLVTQSKEYNSAKWG